VAIVRRGETDVFRTLTERIVQSHLAEVIWDRRTTERRVGPAAENPTDRRRQDRRRVPRGTWGTLGFILTQVAGRSLPRLPARRSVSP
jgi:hypothetical protein